MEMVIEIITWIVLSGIAIGLFATIAFFLWITCKSDPDFEDEDDRDINEHKYWNKNK